MIIDLDLIRNNHLIKVGGFFKMCKSECTSWCLIKCFYSDNLSVLQLIKCGFQILTEWRNCYFPVS